MPMADRVAAGAVIPTTGIPLWISSLRCGGRTPEIVREQLTTDSHWRLLGIAPSMTVGAASGGFPGPGEWCGAAASTGNNMNTG